MVANKRKIVEEPQDILTKRSVNLIELRTHIAQLSKEGYTDISLYDLLTYIRPLVKSTE